MDAKKPATAPAFPLSGPASYRRFFLAALRAAAFLARVRAPLRAEALRWALVLRPPLFLAAPFRPRFLAAAIFVSPR
jgi:hypothetical protein